MSIRISKKLTLVITFISISQLAGCGGGGGSAGGGTGGGTGGGSSSLQLSWSANPDTVSGYKIFYGADNSASTELVTVSSTTPNFNFSAPQYSVDAFNDTGTRTGQQLCFRLKALNNTGESGYSESVCTTV